MKRVLAALIVFFTISAVVYLLPPTQRANLLIEVDQKNQYTNIKRVVAMSIENYNFHADLHTLDGEIDLYYCSDYTRLENPIRIENSLATKLTSLAFEVLVLQDALSAAGYPESVWHDFLAAREQQGLSETDFHRNNSYYLQWYGGGVGEEGDPTLKQFASILNSYRNQGHENLPKVATNGGCGAGGEGVSFETDPPGGRVLLVPKMYYTLCRLQGIDPDDERQCDFWNEVFKEQVAEVSGDYFVKIIWPDHYIIRTFRATITDDMKVTLR